MKMVRKSAEILNAADAFDYRMRVILFQQENYIPYQENSWNVGDPLQPYPNSRLPYGMTELQEDFIYESVERWGWRFDDETWSGNEVRPMLELFYDWEYFEGYHEWDTLEADTNDPFHLWIEDHEFENRCPSCEVDWRGAEPCFVCGEIREDPYCMPSGGGANLMMWDDAVRAQD